MSCLTKKSLFFMVFFIVCNQTFSDRDFVCEDRVYLVYPEDWYTSLALNKHVMFLETWVAFNFSMFALSLKVIDSMTTTGALSTSLLDQFERFKHIFGEDEVRFLSVVGNYVGTRNVEITKSAKTDISGYFKRLIMYFYTIYDEFENGVKCPAKFCAEEYKYDEEECRKTLKYMLRKTTDDEFNEMDAEQAFEHCYLNYRYLDFFDDSIFSELGSSSTTISHNQQQPQNSPLVFSELGSSSTTIPIDQQLIQEMQKLFSESGSSSTTISHNQRQPQKIRLVIAKNYFSKLIAEMYDIVKRRFQSDYELFPSVSQYCDEK